MQNEPNQITPEQSLEILKDFVQYPGVRCFNFSEFSAAAQALACLEAAIKLEEK